MQHAIDPKIDCVFKALLGAEENRNLLVHFLNAFLAPDLTDPLVSVEILNPYNAQECLTDKLSIVDVKARDSQERLYQIEIQLTSYGSLPSRIVYNWADIYSQQLKSGEDYKKLKPTYAIWLLAETLISDDKRYVHHYKFRDEQGGTFVQHGGIWLLELNKFNAQRIETEEQRWLKFFKEGEELNDEALPDWMTTQEMQQAMSILNTFSEKDRQYFQYQARQEFQREQRTIQLELEEARQKEEQAKQQQEQARQEFLREQRTIQLELEEARQKEEQAKQQQEQARQEFLREQRTIQLELEEARQKEEQAKQQQAQVRQEFLREQRTIQLELEEARQKEEQAKQQQEQAREAFLREQRTIQLELEEARQKEEQARQEFLTIQLELEEAKKGALASRQKEDAAQTEIERLKALLTQKQV